MNKSFTTTEKTKTGPLSGETELVDSRKWLKWLVWAQRLNFGALLGIFGFLMIYIPHAVASWMKVFDTSGGVRWGVGIVVLGLIATGAVWLTRHLRYLSNRKGVDLLVRLFLRRNHHLDLMVMVNQAGFMFGSWAVDAARELLGRTVETYGIWTDEKIAHDGEVETFIDVEAADNLKRFARRELKKANAAERKAEEAEARRKGVPMPDFIPRQTAYVLVLVLQSKTGKSALGLKRRLEEQGIKVRTAALLVQDQDDAQVDYAWVGPGNARFLIVPFTPPCEHVSEDEVLPPDSSRPAALPAPPGTYAGLLPQPETPSPTSMPCRRPSRGER